MPTTTNVIASDGVRIAVHDLTASSGSAGMVLAHATGFHGRVFEPLAAQLAARFHCISLDERGHGDSARPPAGDFDWQGFASDVLATIDGSGMAEPFGFGHSCGGAALLLAEQRRPGTFSALYCYEPIIMGPELAEVNGEENTLSVAARKRRAVFGSRQEALDNYSSKPPLSALAPEVLRAYVEHGFADMPDGRVGLKCRPEDEAQVYALAPLHDAYKHLAEVLCPVTIAFGERSDTLGRDHMVDLAERLPRGRVEMLDGLGHFGPLEDPAAVARSVLAASGQNP